LSSSGTSNPENSEESPGEIFAEAQGVNALFPISLLNLFVWLDLELIIDKLLSLRCSLLCIIVFSIVGLEKQIA